MKITHIDSGQVYHLKPGTQLEIERTNLFFNEWGEQSYPIDIPDTDRNRELTDYPDLLSGVKKPSTRIAVNIQDGEYFVSGRQAILSAQRNNCISTSFYINEGSFLSRISDTSLSDIFGDETIPGVTTVQHGVDFCKSLMAGTNRQYAIFPVLIDSDDSYNNGYLKYKFINRVGYEDIYGKWQDGLMTDRVPEFYNAVARTETIDGETINIGQGYYMSPFIRANYLLERIFQYFGYTLLDNFFTKTAPFPDMVFINNCADALVNGTIRLVDLMPDCMCSTILEVFRKKFCCEFIPNEIERTVTIQLFNEVIKETPVYDFSHYLVSPYKNDMPESYQQIILSSEESVSDAGSVESPDSLPLLVNKYQYVNYDPVDGSFYRKGFMYGGIMMFNSPFIISVRDRVASSSMRYYDGGNLKTKEIKVPDMLPEFRNVYNAFSPNDYGDLASPSDKFLYIGAANFLNSKLIKSGSSDSTGNEANTTSENSSLKPILAFYYKEVNYPRGTITNQVNSFSGVLLGTRRLSDYSLCYNGTDGIFERFYRSYDDIYRNSLRKVTASLLLPDVIKRSLPAHLPVLLHNQKLLINTLKYTIGGKNEPMDTELFTTKLYEPISSAKQFSDHISGINHGWVSKYTVVDVSQQEYDSNQYKDAPFETIFPQKPTDDLAISGKRYYEQKSCIKFQVSAGIKYMFITWWLECI